MRHGIWWLAAGLTVLVFCGGAQLRAQSPEESARARHQMVATFIEKEGVRDPRVLAAMRSVPRDEFLPFSLRRNAYVDAAWSIGYKQTISPPFIVAYMTAALDPRPGDRVLEIGTGSGYQAAVLSLLVKEVYSIEIVEPLGIAAKERLARLGYQNVKTKIGDGYLGWPQFAPFDKIIVTCSPENVPKPLIDQLRENGKMIIPLGERYHQDFFLLQKQEGKLVRRKLMPTLFVPMIGRSETERTVQPDPLKPRLHNGGFERSEADGQLAGWHYQRQVTATSGDAAEGRSCALFENADFGRISQALQGLAIDGQRVGELRFALKVRTDRVNGGLAENYRAGLRVFYYDAQRQHIVDIQATDWAGSAPWHDVAAAAAVPKAAREAVICLGLHGATGRLYVDDVRMTAVAR